MSTVADLLHGRRFVSAEPVTAGWSNDRKLRVTTTDGRRYLMRISRLEHFVHCRRVYDLMSRVAAKGVPICRPVELHVCDDGVAMLLEWIDGDDLRPVLPHLPAARQRALGVTAGQHLRSIHTLEAPDDVVAWPERFGAKIAAKVDDYLAANARFDGDAHVLRFVTEQRHLLDGRPQCLQHGDYHDGNMMLRADELIVIDFDRADVGDPWQELDRIVWSAQHSPEFASGQLHGYFDGDPPNDFFPLLALYIATNTLSSLPWAARLGEDQVAIMRAQAHDALAWYGDMTTAVPSWYLPVGSAPSG